MKRSIFAGAAALALGVGLAAPASAGSGSATVGNFYLNGSCTASNGARLTVTNYDKTINGQDGQEYHYNWTTSSGWSRFKITFDGWSDSLVSDGYFASTDYVDKKKIVVTWRSSGGAYVSCTVNPNPL